MSSEPMKSAAFLPAYLRRALVGHRVRLNRGEGSAVVLWRGSCLADEPWRPEAFRLQVRPCSDGFALCRFDASHGWVDVARYESLPSLLRALSPLLGG